MVQERIFLTAADIAGGRLAVCRVGLLTENWGKVLWREEKQGRIKVGAEFGFRC